MSKLLKNTTVSDIFIADTGINLLASSTYTIPELDYLIWTRSTDISTHITSGAVVVNDGVNDLSAFAGANFLLYPDAAFNVRFLSEPERNNGFTSKTVQEAIEEVSGAGLIYYSATGTSTLTRSASTFTTVSGMTHTPEAGTYLALWSGQIDTGSPSGQGEVAVFVSGTQQAALTHQTQLIVTIVLSLLGVAQSTEGGSNITGLIVADGVGAVDVRYRSVDGQTITIKNRSFVLIRIA